MSLQTRIGDLITAVGTDYKQLRSWITGSSSGNLTSLTTTAKTDLIAAINEVNAKPAGTSPAATEIAAGIAEIATQVETDGATDDSRIVTPFKLRGAGDARWQLKTTNLDNLATFTTSTDATLAGNSDTVLSTQKAVKAYADGLIDARNAFRYVGVIDASTNPNYPAGNAGDVYKISVAGRIGGASGPAVEVGDTVTLLVDNSVAGNHATVGANWIITQTNIDGAVVGPASSVSGDFLTFSGTTGKVVGDSGVSLETDVTLASNSNARVPSTLAVRAYMVATYYNKTEMGNPEIDLVALYTTAKA